MLEPGWIRALIVGLLSLSACATAVQSHGAEAGSAPGTALTLNPSIAIASPDHRTLVEYLVGCALPAGVEIEADHAGRKLRFAGSLGLAPAWTDRALTLAEQRWVSACILARTNYFGKRVEISLRARPPAPAGLRASPAESAAFSLLEGGFFGNVFAVPPTAFVCTPRRPAGWTPDPALRDRVCTALAGEIAATGEPVTRCGFVHTGICPGANASVAERQTIFVYLRPGAGPGRQYSNSHRSTVETKP